MISDVHLTRELAGRTKNLRKRADSVGSIEAADRQTGRQAMADQLHGCSRRLFEA